MKNKLGIIALAAIIAFSFFGCGDDEGGGSGTFTLTNIPAEHNGKYVFVEAKNNSVYLLGANSFNMSEMTAALPQISDGSVSVPMWIFTNPNNPAEYKRYSGNDTVGLDVAILNEPTPLLNEQGKLDNDPERWIGFDELKLSNGSATKAYNDYDWENNFDY